MTNPGLPAESTDSCLTVERLTCHINMPAGIEYPLAAREQISRIVQHELAGVCAEVLAHLPEDGDAVYRIRRLDLDLWVDLQGMSEADIVTRWARLLAGSTMRAMARGGPGQVMRFDSAQHLVASFLRDLIDGRAWQQWYYEEFRLLERLPLPRLAVELLAPRPHWIAPILLALAATGHSDRLIERWAESDIGALWQALGFPATPALVLRAGRTLSSALAQVWRRTALSGGVEGAARARDRLRLWLALADHDPSHAQDAETAGIIQALVDLAALLRIEPELAPLLLMESEPYPALLKRISSGPLATVVGWLAEAAADEAGRRMLRQVVEVIQSRDGGRAVRLSRRPEEAAEARDRAVAPVALTSPVGGAFLLVPALAETGLWQRWLDEVGEEVARRYLFVVALKSLGRERAPLHLGDPMLAALAGLEEPPMADLRRPPEPDGPAGEWVQGLPAIAERWYPARERRLQAAVLAGIGVVRDETAACWLAAWPDEAFQADDIVERWQKITADPAAIRCALDESEREAIEAEARHLQLGPKLGYSWLTPTLDAALSVVASLVMRRTAARLPRFGQASPAYLARQFLAQPASLRTTQDVWNVQLSGGPLAVVLRLASLPETVDAPWLPLPLHLRLSTRIGI